MRNLQFVQKQRDVGREATSKETRNEMGGHFMVHLYTRPRSIRYLVFVHFR